MRIERIEVANLMFEYPGAARFRFAGGTCTGRLTSLIVVTADSGLTGIGSCYSHPGLVGTIVETQFDPILRGRDPLDVESIWDELYRLTRWYGRKGAALSAIGGLDVALWDLRGKHLGVPVWKLLGATSAKVPAYASALLWKDDVRDLAREAAGHIDHGFRRVKMRLGRSEEYDTAAVRAVRDSVGPEHDVIVDASMRYRPQDAQRMEPILREAGVFWWEEPFQPEDLDSYASLQASTALRVAAGENKFGLPGFRELVARQAVGIVQPDVSRSGGITEVRRIGEMAAASGIRVATHTWSDAIAVVANAHVVASMPNGLTVEVDQTHNPFIDDLLVEPLLIDDGLLDLGDRPGLGIEVRPDAVTRYRMTDPIRPPDGNYSDMAFGQGMLQPAPPWHVASS